MRQSMVLYDLNDKKPAERTRIIRTLYGFKDKSCYGKYEYARKGLLYGIRYMRKTKTAIIVSEKDGQKVVEILKKMGITPIVALVRG